MGQTLRQAFVELLQLGRGLDVLKVSLLLNFKAHGRGLTQLGAAAPAAGKLSQGSATWTCSAAETSPSFKPQLPPLLAAIAGHFWFLAVSLRLSPNQPADVSGWLLEGSTAPCASALL